MIVNVRGINGSGKTTLVRQVLELADGEPTLLDYRSKTSKRDKVWPLQPCYTPAGRVIVHGRYDVQQGGVDTEKDMDAADAQLRRGFEMFPRDHRIFEGMVASKSGARFAKMAQDVLRTHPEQSWHWVFLDTPLDECIRRIMGRNGGKPVKRHLMENGERSVKSTRLRFSDLQVGKISRFGNGVGDIWELFQ